MAEKSAKELGEQICGEMIQNLRHNVAADKARRGNKIEELYRELEKHAPESPESYRLAEEIVEAIFEPEYPLNGVCC